MNKYQKKISEFYNLSKNFNVKFAIGYIKNRHTLGHERFSVYVQRILESYFSPVIDYYKNGNKDFYSIKRSKSLNSNIVWQCWWQGEQGMPNIVKMCVKQMQFLCEQIPDVQYVLVTKENYKEFIDLPDFLISKLEKGYISLTFFSDVLRQSLLSTYGGAWIDSTVLCTSRNGIEQLFQTPFFSIKIEKEKVNRFSEGQVLTGGRWAGFFLNNVGINTFSFVRDCLLYYIERQDYLMNFYMQNYCIKIAVDNNFDNVGNLVDNQSVFCNHVYFIEECFKKGEKVSLKDDTFFYKLSYKIFSDEQIHQLEEYLKREGIITA
ncbi:polysaccharide biosynthesis protein [Claveliimonas bilis]|uniref:capsular polysaccharide synthesis protein n=1 Tax=Claveliimonas bilis TaxID=3028070 RepID=UPI002931171C|nr:capsular polysaccharide synthesis protein [Claveliimonas bilis]BDZ82325.1 polysaccharide biosynthesis protein [Claveliimonas bilis]